MRKNTNFKETLDIMAEASVNMDTSLLRKINLGNKQRLAIAASLFLGCLCLLFVANKGIIANFLIFVGAISVTGFFLRASLLRRYDLITKVAVYAFLGTMPIVVTFGDHPARLQVSLCWGYSIAVILSAIHLFKMFKTSKKNA